MSSRRRSVRVAVKVTIVGTSGVITGGVAVGGGRATVTNGLALDDDGPEGVDGAAYEDEAERIDRTSDVAVAAHVDEGVLADSSGREDGAGVEANRGARSPATPRSAAAASAIKR